MSRTILLQLPQTCSVECPLATPIHKYGVALKKSYTCFFRGDRVISATKVMPVKKCVDAEHLYTERKAR